ncbi:hypothetical protein ACHAWX_007239 [Stephanocyclus meneghinianus]
MTSTSSIIAHSPPKPCSPSPKTKTQPTNSYEPRTAIMTVPLPSSVRVVIVRGLEHGWHVRSINGGFAETRLLSGWRRGRPGFVSNVTTIYVSSRKRLHLHSHHGKKTERVVRKTRRRRCSPCCWEVSNAATGYRSEGTHANDDEITSSRLQFMFAACYPPQFLIRWRWIRLWLWDRSWSNISFATRSAEAEEEGDGGGNGAYAYPLVVVKNW